MLITEAPFYLNISYSKDSGRFWFKASAMGLNKLSSSMKTMAKKAGLDEKKKNDDTKI